MLKALLERIGNSLDHDLVRQHLTAMPRVTLRRSRLTAPPAPARADGPPQPVRPLSIFSAAASRRTPSSSLTTNRGYWRRFRASSPWTTFLSLTAASTPAWTAWCWMCSTSKTLSHIIDPDRWNRLSTSEGATPGWL